MKTLILTSLFLAIFIQGQAFANIRCETPRKNKVFNISKESVAIIQRDQFKPERTIASLGARTKIKGKGFTKVMNFEGNKYFIHIDDTKNFSEVNDYLYIKSPRGHQMTYPLICTKG